MSENSEPIKNLFGDLLPPNWGMRGRPQHVRSDENANKIMHGLSQGWPDARIAAALGISVPTMKRYYFAVLKMRDVARDKIEMEGLAKLWALGREGNVAAMKEYFRRFDAAVGDVFSADVEKEARKLGKKERDRIEADNPPEEWEATLPTVAH
jgi:hypothetical protein